MRRRSSLIVLLLAASACNSGETSISLIFPNEVARAATRRLSVAAYDPATNAATATDRTCADFLDKARVGTPPVGNPNRGDFSCQMDCPPTWFADSQVNEVEAGKRIIYVLGFATADEGATPILEGCNDRFDTDGGGDERNEVPVELKLVIPDSARLVKSRGDRQVGRAGEQAGVPLQVRVEAEAPGGTGGPYVIPGVPLSFNSKNPDFRITTGDDPTRYATYSDENGTAQIDLLLPTQPGQGDIDAEAPALEVTKTESRSKVTFSVSVTSPITFPIKDVVNPGGDAHPIAAAIGQLVPGGTKELAILSCQGSVEGCRPGLQAIAPLGLTQLNVLSDIPGGKNNVSIQMPPQGLGLLPAGLAIGNLLDGGAEELAVVNSRRQDCQSRICLPNEECGCYRPDPNVTIACGCEGSEVLVFGSSGSGLQVEQRMTMTGSNAVGLAMVKQGAASGTGLFNVVVAAQGRSQSTRPCSRGNRCLPYRTAADCAKAGDPPAECSCLGDPGLNCGCPPAERCECISGDCTITQTPGNCVARDKLVDLVARKAGGAQILYNRYGCQRARIKCDNTGDSTGTESRCEDFDDLGNTSSGKDGCNCKVPDRIQIGDTDSPVTPFGIAGGALHSTEDYDLIVPSIGGLELIESKVGTQTYAWKTEPVINAPIHAAIVVQMDPLTQGENAASPADVIWYSRSPCLTGTNFVERCPIWRDLPPETQVRGCLGLYFTAGARSLFEPKPETGGCRRHLLDFTPDGMCTGDFNGDGSQDVILASRTETDLLVYSGDGRGGLLDPPERLALPGGSGGPMTCGDLDGDNRDDAVVLDLATGLIQILRSGL